MTPAVARKVKELVSAGATVGGEAPLKSPSLLGYPKSDEEVSSIGDEVWRRHRLPVLGDLPILTPLFKPKGVQFGKGQVVAGASDLAIVLGGLGVRPDFEYN